MQSKLAAVASQSQEKYLKLQIYTVQGTSQEEKDSTAGRKKAAPFMKKYKAIVTENKSNIQETYIGMRNNEFITIHNFHKLLFKLQHRKISNRIW